MASDCSSIEEKMADIENSYVLDAPANILRYGVVEKISMQLSIDGTLVNWKNVADKLGFSNLAISGHYANFSGSEAALTMLNDWIFKKNGKIRALVRVFLSLELHGCLEDLKEDLENYQQESKTAPKKNEDEDRCNSLNDDTLLHSAVVTSSAPDLSITSTNTSGPASYESKYLSDCSSRLDSFSSTIPDSSLQSNNSSALTSMQSDISVDSLPRPIPSLLRERAWPELSSRDYQRSTSVPEEKIHRIKPKKRSLLKHFKRSKSFEPETKTHKKKPWFRKDTKKKNKPGKSIGSGKTSVEENTGNTSVTAQHYYSEQASTLKPNLSPLIVVEGKVQRPVSSGSEDSLPCSPSSPTSPGYESGYNSGDNSFKRIYIVCNPDEEVVFQLALKMYLTFCKKGYECHMFATDLKEVMEVGRFRYEMQQVKDADYVFLCVSKKLKEIFEVSVSKVQKFKDDDTRGLRHVSNFMMTFFANDCCNKNGKFMTILLTKDSYDHVPFVMKSYLKYNWPEQEKRMENIIHKRSGIPLHPVSDAKIYAPIKVCTPKGVVNASVREDDTQV